MADSGFVYEEGDPIEVGSHGEHDYVFHEGEPVTDTGDSTLVFESGTGLGGQQVIDDFERGNLDPYTGDLGAFSVTTAPTWDGSYALNASANNSHIWSNSLENVPVRGDTFHFLMQIHEWWNTLHFGFGQTSAKDTSGYQAGIRADDSDVYLTLYKESSPDTFGSTDPTITSEYTLGEWIAVEVEWGDPTITARAKDATDGAVIAEISEDDTEYDGGQFCGWDTTNSNTNASGFEMYADECVLGGF